MGKKFIMPTVKEFLDMKTIYGPKKDPVWVYLEREMRENIENKPYNEKVGAWLKFLRDLRFHYFCEALRKKRRLKREVGPAWYCEFSSTQREVLASLKPSIHQDLLEDLPMRTRQVLSDLGVTLKIPKNILMQAMKSSGEDDGVFIWNLYTALYKKAPSELRPRYEKNATILMSSMVFIDLSECIEKLEKLTANPIEKSPAPVKKQRKNTQPNVRYGEYLQKCYVPCYTPHSKNKPPSKPPPIGYKFRLRSQASYEKLCKTHDFLQKRIERNKKVIHTERVCNYKFWEPPSTLRNTDPKMVAYVEKMKMLKKRPKAKHRAPYNNVQYSVGNVAFSGGRPHYVLNGVCILPTGYIPINGGMVSVNSVNVTNILGYWKFPKEEKEACDSECECMVKWESAVLDFLQESKCQCGHLFDFRHLGKAAEKYFYQASRNAPHWFDEAKIFQMDPTEDFIKDTVYDALRSKDPTPEPSMPTLSASGLSEKELLAVFLADLSDTPLIIPHLPEANLLHNLQEWVRKRVHGKLSETRHKNMLLHSLRRWLELKHVDFRARAYYIPFTLEHLKHLNWSHRHFVQKLFKIMLHDFVTRNRLQQMEQTRLWWPTMKYDPYPSKAFLDIFYTYMPGRIKDTFLINPYSSERTAKYGAKTCPLSL